MAYGVDLERKGDLFPLQERVNRKWILFSFAAAIHHTFLSSLSLFVIIPLSLCDTTTSCPSGLIFFLSLSISSPSLYFSFSLHYYLVNPFTLQERLAKLRNNNACMSGELHYLL